MIRVEAAGRSDPGRVRQTNEDAYLVGDTVFAVADGMGGHVAGEVAARTALEPLAQLDGRVFGDATEALEALRAAVRDANTAVARRAEAETELHGMGTTLTAALLEGRRLHVAHVGDSRAYLWRGGQFSQLTTDHTLVQRLLDRGEITAEQAATHPKRSIITRAIGVSGEVEVDTLTVELEPGDQVLLCSDGLTGPVTDEEIAALLAADLPVGEVVERLVALANERGGEDNITAVLLRVAPARRQAPTGPTPVASGTDAAPAAATAAGAERPVTVIRTGGEQVEDHDWVRSLQRIGTIGRVDTRTPEPTGPDRSRWRRWGGILVGVAVLIGVVVGATAWLLSRSYYVGLDGEQVVIYRGIPAEVGPFELSWVHERTELTIDDVPAFYASRLEAGIAAADLADARRIVANAPRREDAAGGGPSPTGTAPEVSPSPTPAGPGPEVSPS